MRIYDGDFTVRNLIDDCSVQTGEIAQPGRRIVEGIDLDKLNERLNLIPVEEIRHRRQRMNVFWHEAMLEADPELGVSFTSCLMILAHYNLINDNKSLRLEEFLRRRARLQRVHESIRRSVVVGFFDMMYWSRRLQRRREQRDSRLAAPPHLPVPAIFVENPDESIVSRASTEPHDFTTSVPLRSPDLHDQSSTSRGFNPRSLPRLDTHVRRRDSPQSGERRSSDARRPSFDLSPTESPGFDPNRLRSIDYGAGSPSPAGPALHSRRGSAVSAISEQGVVESFDASAWAESIRRSFTINRPQ